MAEKVQRKTPKAPRKRQWQPPRVKSGQAVRVQQPRVRQDGLTASAKTAGTGNAAEAHDIRRLAGSRDELLLSIGGVVCRLELWRARQQTFIDQLRARYCAFELPAAPWVQDDISLRLNLVSAPPPGTRDRSRRARKAPADRQGDRARRSPSRGGI